MKRTAQFGSRWDVGSELDNTDDRIEGLRAHIYFTMRDEIGTTHYRVVGITKPSIDRGLMGTYYKEINASVIWDDSDIGKNEDRKDVHRGRTTKG